MLELLLLPHEVLRPSVAIAIIATKYVFHFFSIKSSPVVCWKEVNFFASSEMGDKKLRFYFVGRVLFLADQRSLHHLDLDVEF
jgi:hypothetical protein